MNDTRPVAVVAGAGPGNGQSLAKAFDEAGYAVALLARDSDTLASIAEELEHAYAFSCDVTDAANVEAVFADIVARLGPVDALLYNAGSGVFADIEDITPEDFEAAWRVNAYGALLASRQVIGSMKERKAGSIIFIGATASLRGNVMTAAFAPAKAAQRSLAQSMARSLWPCGIHVALIVIDGVIDNPKTRAQMPDRASDQFVDPDAVAATALHLTKQDRQGWSFEVETRPFTEDW